MRTIICVIVVLGGVVLVQQPGWGDGIVSGQIKPKTDSSAEELILAALAKQVQSLSYVEKPLNEVIDDIGEAYQINVRVDARALDTVGLVPDTPITLEIKNVSLKSALGLMLDELELTWIIKHETLMITTQEEANANLITRVYDVKDLVLVEGEDEPLLVVGPFGYYNGSSADFGSLIQIITSTIEPESWDEVGGPGSIDSYEYQGKCVLVFAQTEAIHEQIEQLLATLRAVPSDPAPKKVDNAKDEEKDVKIFTQVYPIAKTYRATPDELAKLVKTAIGPDQWIRENGTSVEGIAETIVVKHNRKVHNRVSELLIGVDALLLPHRLGGGFGDQVPAGAGDNGGMPTGGFFNVRE